MVILYGIKNCDTVRKARRWLAKHRVDYRFHDLRSDGLDHDQLDAWIEDLGWEHLLNRRGTTWRQLPAEAREPLDAARARKLMLEYPAIIKRPLLAIDTAHYLGFSDERYASLFSKAAP
jgi:Spx/MgsR family transcriptional regulator